MSLSFAKDGSWPTCVFLVLRCFPLNLVLDVCFFWFLRDGYFKSWTWIFHERIRYFNFNNKNTKIRISKIKLKLKATVFLILRINKLKLVFILSWQSKRRNEIFVLKVYSISLVETFSKRNWLLVQKFIIMIRLKVY